MLSAISQFFRKFGTSSKMDKMRIVVLPALSDNYMYLIIDQATKEAAVVDPVTPAKVLSAIEEEGVKLTKVLTTHHHWDHAGGNEDLVKQCGNKLDVYGGDSRIGALTHEVKHGDSLSIGSIKVQCLLTPCHTTGHVCYYAQCESQTPAVFTGDTLFVGGCGRFFEGTAEQMHTALNGILGKLPNNTQVYCGHEYTLQNLKFAQQIEPTNGDIAVKMVRMEDELFLGRPTVPSTIKDEKDTNPFMRVDEEVVQMLVGAKSAVDAMRIIRAKKDVFKG